MFGIRATDPLTAPHGSEPHGAPYVLHGGTRSEDQAHHPRSGISRRTRLIAVSTGLVAAAAIAIPSANASEAPTTFSSAELKSVSGSVLEADVPGTAWAVDSKTNRVVVTVDSTVSEAEIAKIKQEAGADADALQIKRTPGQFTKLIQGGDAIYASSWRCSSASTSAAAAASSTS